MSTRPGWRPLAGGGGGGSVSAGDWAASCRCSRLPISTIVSSVPAAMLCWRELTADMRRSRSLADRSDARDAFSRGLIIIDPARNASAAFSCDAHEHQTDYLTLRVTSLTCAIDAMYQGGMAVGGIFTSDGHCKDKDKDLTHKDQDKDKDFTYSYLLQVAAKRTIAIKQ